MGGYCVATVTNPGGSDGNSRCLVAKWNGASRRAVGVSGEGRGEATSSEGGESVVVVYWHVGILVHMYGHCQ